MNKNKLYFPLGLTAIVFFIIYYLPVEQIGFDNFVTDALFLAKWYAREHVLLCLIPALFIAGAISVFVSQTSVIKHLGPGSNKVTAYGVASVSGGILAVCSCTVLPIFAGIYRMGAGIGPASAFLYAGPAVNVLAVILTARILGTELGIARAVGAVIFSIIIGLFMQLIFRRDRNAKINSADVDEKSIMPLWKNGIYFGLMTAILVFANWSGESSSGWAHSIFAYKWWLTSAASVGLAAVLLFWFGLNKIKLGIVVLLTLISGIIFNNPTVPFTIGAIGLSVLLIKSPGEPARWFESSWDLAKQIFPLLLIGVLIAGALMGRPGGSGLIPEEWIYRLVGGNSIGANLIASVVGAFMYFATLTEVPILQGLISNGMGKGPALALLLAGPALSLPNMLVIRSIMGTKKTVVFIGLVIIMSTLMGTIYGNFI